MVTKQPIPLIDHLVLILPYDPKTGGPLIPSAFHKHFTIVPGGTHADNLTANALIPLADGSYIELICFLPQPEKRRNLITKHWWGPDPGRTGWTDWCLTSLDPSKPVADETTGKTVARDGYKFLKLEYMGDQIYADPVKGGRRRPDGTDVQWHVTFPKSRMSDEEQLQTTRGMIPFWCHDITPRSLRVPESESSLASPTPSSSPPSRERAPRHRSEVLGVVALSVLVNDQREWSALREIYKGLFGNPFQATKFPDNKIPEDVGQWRAFGYKLGRVKPIAKAEKMRVSIFLQYTKGDIQGEHKIATTGRGFWFGDVVLAVRAGKRKVPGRVERIDGTGEDNLGGVFIKYI